MGGIITTPNAPMTPSKLQNDIVTALAKEQSALAGAINELFQRSEIIKEAIANQNKNIEGFNKNFIETEKVINAILGHLSGQSDRIAELEKRINILLRVSGDTPCTSEENGECTCSDKKELDTPPTV